MNALLLVTLCSLLCLSSSIHHRDGVTVATYVEALEMYRNNPDFRYLIEPMIITDSPMSDWTLYENLEKIFGSDYDIEVNHQSTDCDCFADSAIQYELCEQFASSFLYFRENAHYKYWSQFEAKHKESSKYMHCLHKVPDQNMSVSEAIHRIAAKDGSTHLYVENVSYTKNTQYSKLYSYYNIFHMHHEEELVTALQLNTLDQIRLSAYFDIFDIKGFADVKDIHIWFGTEYYRAMRHFDKCDNLFFVLEGSRIFRVSDPSLNVFPLHPFGHSSNRQQYPYYPLLEAADGKDGIAVPDEYRISEVEVFANEVFYLPGFWHHEVINNNFTVAMNVWWDSIDERIERDMEDVRLPINPARQDGIMDRSQIDAFLYFTQRLIERFCDVLHEDKASHATINHMIRCMDSQYKGYGFLTISFRQIYRILDEFTYDNFEWIAMVVDVENIIKCSQDRISDYDYRNVTEFKNDLYFCWDFEDEFKKEWDGAVGVILNMLLDFTHPGISELVLQEYLENILVALSEDSNMLPIWLKMMYL